MAPIPARRERAALADLFQAVGPDHPTLCGDWTTRDLAAHLVVRERRPDAFAGIVAGRYDSTLATRLEDHHSDVVTRAATRDWADLVAAVRAGPPTWSPLSRAERDRDLNTTEFFIHHEDVRRATPGWEPRELDDDLEHDLDRVIAGYARRLGSIAPDGLMLLPTGRPPIVARRRLPMVEVHGPIGEIALFLYGRTEQARVTIRVPDDAPADLADNLRNAPWGV